MKMLIVYGYIAFQGTTQNSDIASVKGGWIIAAHDQTLRLSTADGTKTITDLLTEANTTLRRTVIPSGNAYEIVGIVVANGDATASQVILDPSFSVGSLITDLSSYNLRGVRTNQQSSGSVSITYTLDLPNARLTAYNVSLSSKTISGSKIYGAEVPASGTTTYITYNLWKEI